MSLKRCYFFFYLFAIFSPLFKKQHKYIVVDKIVQLVGWGSVINGAYPVSFCCCCIFWPNSKNVESLFFLLLLLLCPAFLFLGQTVSWTNFFLKWARKFWQINKWEKGRRPGLVGWSNAMCMDKSINLEKMYLHRLRCSNKRSIFLLLSFHVKI